MCDSASAQKNHFIASPVILTIAKSMLVKLNWTTNTYYSLAKKGKD